MYCVAVISLNYHRVMLANAILEYIFFRPVYLLYSTTIYQNGQNLGIKHKPITASHTTNISDNLSQFVVR